MELEYIQNIMRAFLESCPENYVSAEDAIRPELAGMRIYDDPLFGVGVADDPLFRRLQEPYIVGPGMLLPIDWLAEAKSVVSFFLPFTEVVRRSNRVGGIASDEWLHARIEGQMMMNSFGAFLCGQLNDMGFDAVYPAADPRFKMQSRFASNWSERHVAYICGLGTFGLSKGLITRKGMAGRFGSVVTAAELPVTEREYSSPFEYCTMCGTCQKSCPAMAIDAGKGVARGKDHGACSAYLNANEQPPHGPNQRVRYGCGKCQVGVPCESRIPRR